MNRKTTRTLTAFLASCLLATIAAAETPSTESVPTPSEGARIQTSYLLQPGDVVEISVWKEDSLSKTLLVRPDGGLSFPLAGDLTVAGHTATEVQTEIQQRLGKFLSDPTVTATVVQISGNQVYVVGKVNRPGSYKLERKVDVMQALSLAGGTMEFADVDDIRIIRRDPDGLQSVLQFKYSDVARGRKLEQNIVLQSGDTLVVP